MVPLPRRILLVEDEPDIRQTLHDLLTMVPDCSVEDARNFAEGKARAHEGGWAAVVCDERLPDGRGVDILAEVSRSTPGTLLVLMSAFQDFDTMLRSVNVAHIDHFFQKPVDPGEVLHWLGKALEQKIGRAHV